MNRRQAEKTEKKLLLWSLENAVRLLNDNNAKYKAHVVHIPLVEKKTIAKINGYRIEIRSSREEKHNYAHFHVVKGTDGQASIRIDTLEVLESSLPKKDLNKVLNWAQDNQELLKKIWNGFHGYRITV